MRLAVPLLPGLWLGRLLWQYAESSGWAGLFLSIGVLLSGGVCGQVYIRCIGVLGMVS